MYKNMKNKHNYQITEFCHKFVKDYIEPGDCCIDATCGNGYDTEFLCRIVGEQGIVYAFDIQESAIERTAERLERLGYTQRVKIFCESHVNMAVRVEREASVIMFNFGYLPGGDHSLATQPESSKKAVEQGLGLLKKGGIMSLCIYSGGDTGYAERDMLLTYLEELDPSKWLVIACSYYNRKNDPPQPVFVIRLV